MDYNKQSLEAHRAAGGKITVTSKLPITNREELSTAYTPGVAAVSRAVHEDPAQARELIATKNMVAVITDGSAVLGLGDIGPEAALPVMEGKAALFKTFANVDAFPIAIATQDVDEFVQTVINIAPTFGGINLEDIAAPRCFEIERQLKEKLSIPVFHDDQHGTAIVVLAGLITSLKLVGKELATVRIVISGAGAAGIAIAKLLHRYGAKDIIMTDSKGIIVTGRADLNPYKEEALAFTNQNNQSGTIQDALQKADVFIGVSKGGLLTADDIKDMNADAIVFAMANPDPEILPDEAKAGGARIIATGRSDFPNQLNNVLAFPGVFKGALAAQTRDITDDMQIAAAEALAAAVPNPTDDNIIPDPFTPSLADKVAEAVQHSSK